MTALRKHPPAPRTTHSQPRAGQRYGGMKHGDDVGGIWLPVNEETIAEERREKIKAAAVFCAAFAIAVGIIAWGGGEAWDTFTRKPGVVWE